MGDVVTGSSGASEQRRHNQLFEHMPLGVLILDPQGNVTDSNPSVQAILGFLSAPDLSKVNVFSFPPFVEAGIDKDVQRCLKTGETVISERLCTDGRGKLIHLRLHCTPELDEPGRQASVQVIVEDISEQELAEKALHEFQQRLEDQNAELNKLSHAIEQSANIVVITDLEGCIEYVNPKFVEITGYSAAEVQGKNPRILKSGEQSDAYYRILWQTITAGEQWRGEFHNRRKDGSLYWEQASIAPILDASGQMTHFIAIKEDITERKRAEVALHRTTERLKILHEIDQSVLAAQVPDTIAVAAIHRIRRLIPCQRVTVMALTESGEISMLAAASSGEIESAVDASIYEELFSKHPLGIGLVHGCEDLALLPHRSALQQALFDVGTQSYVAVPLFIQNELVGTLNLESTEPKAFTADHIAIALEVAASLAVAIRQARLYERAQRELAERMQAERALRQYTVDLEARNAELDAFAHTVAHDLKNPVSSIVGYSDVLNRNLSSFPTEVLAQFMDVIARNAHKMSAIIDELLLLSSVRGMDEIELQPLEMGRIVAEARGRLLHLIEERQGEIHLPDGWPVALGYGPWVEVVWTNYIGNALKYGGTPPTIELGATEQGDGWIRFWVRDNGAGLSPAEQARLFTPFERLHQTRAEGHGLGLSIVQRITKKLGGQVGVESEGVPGRGCTFYFTLPALSTT